jgi:hypothetical protein
MEDLLASIRKAIQDDIGEVPATTSTRASGILYKGPVREYHIQAGEDAGSAAAEIQQLRERIQRSRVSDVPVRETPVQARLGGEPTVGAARRSWRDLEPTPSLRPTVIDTDAGGRPARRDYIRPRPEPRVEPEPVVAESWHDEPPLQLPPPRERAAPHEPGMMSGDAAEAVQAAFNRLAQNMFSQATCDRSVEDLTRDLLRGMLKQWLDDNLPQLVERLVREEIERVARHGR